MRRCLEHDKDPSGPYRWLVIIFVSSLGFLLYVRKRRDVHSIYSSVGPSSPSCARFLALSHRCSLRSPPPFGSQFQTLPDNPRSHGHRQHCDILRGCSSLATCECLPYRSSTPLLSKTYRAFLAIKSENLELSNKVMCEKLVQFES